MRALPLALLWSMLIGAEAHATTHVVAVGNNLGHRDEPQLRFAERDAQEFTNVLRRLGHVTAENTRLLLGEDAEAFRRVLLNANVLLRASGAEEDALIIYYSGHADASGLHLGPSTLPYDELKALVEGSPARVRLLIVDSCRSGGITEIKGASPTAPFAVQIDHRLEAEGLAIITSSAETEDSQESESLRSSFFTHHFVTALRGAADLDKDGRVTLNEAYGYAYRGTLQSTGRTTKLQHPTYRYELKGKGDFVLTFLESTPSQTGRLSIPEAGSYLVLEGNEAGSVVAELTVEAEGTSLVLQPGRYFVRRRADTFYREYSVDIGGGEEVDLARRPYEEITYARLLRKGGGARENFHSLSLMGSIGDAIIEGYGTKKAVAFGYGMDLAWITLGAEARFGLASGANATVTGSERELGVRIRAERFIDLRLVSLALGVLVEGVNIHQGFQADGDAPSRDAWSIGFGSLLALERPLLAQLVARLELGLVTHLVPIASIEGGAQISERTGTPLSVYGALGARFSL